MVQLVHRHDRHFHLKLNRLAMDRRPVHKYFHYHHDHEEETTMQCCLGWNNPGWNRTTRRSMPPPRSFQSCRHTATTSSSSTMGDYYSDVWCLYDCDPASPRELRVPRRELNRTHQLRVLLFPCSIAVCNLFVLFYFCSFCFVLFVRFF